MWRLVEFQPVDDTTDTLRPADSCLYTINLKEDNTVIMCHSCDHASGVLSFDQYLIVKTEVSGNERCR